jgi:hypothetical protein
MSRPERATITWPNLAPTLTKKNGESGICSAIDDCAKENLDHSQVGTKDVDYFLGVEELYKINRTA